jgi:hypothetical protein
VRRCLSRDPKEREARVLQDFLTRQKQRFNGGGADPWPLVASDETSKKKLAAELPPGVTATDLASWTALARVILNLDETITKE